MRNAHAPTGIVVAIMAIFAFLFGFALVFLPKPAKPDLEAVRAVNVANASGTPVPRIVYSSHKGMSGKGLIWPFHGPISSYYGPWHPLGIDIDGNDRKVGDPIVAATSGVVVFAGGNRCCSYGNYVVIMEQTAPTISDGFFEFTPGIETLYAHMDSLAVKHNDQVVQGQVIGGLGSTGYSTGPHLHFEVIDTGVRVNPIDYLP